MRRFKNGRYFNKFNLFEHEDEGTFRFYKNLFTSQSLSLHIEKYDSIKIQHTTGLTFLHSSGNTHCSIRRILNDSPSFQFEKQQWGRMIVTGISISFTKSCDSNYLYSVFPYGAPQICSAFFINHTNVALSQLPLGNDNNLIVSTVVNHSQEQKISFHDDVSTTAYGLGSWLLTDQNQTIYGQWSFCNVDITNAPDPNNLLHVIRVHFRVFVTLMDKTI